MIKETANRGRFFFLIAGKFLRTWESVIIKTEERKTNIFSNIDSSGGVIQWEKL